MHQWKSLALVGLVVFAFAALGGTARAQDMMMQPPPEDPRMDVLLGEWHGNCEVQGMSATIVLTWGWELGHQFLVSHSNDVFTLPDGNTMTAETIYYNKPQGDGTYAGTFYSSMGTVQDYTMRWDGDSLVAEWPDMGGGAGRWTGAITAEGALQTEASMTGPDGTMVPVFACTYTRAAE